MPRLAFAVLAILLAATSFAQPTPVTTPDAFERILVPILVPPANGAFGSRFVTRLELWNRHDRDRLEIFGLLPMCVGVLCAGDPLAPVEVLPYTETQFSTNVVMNGTPGRFIYVEKERADDLIANLRVFDESRSSTNFGTEVRVVPESDFATRIILPGVPVPFNSQFRNTLRIYATRQVAVQVIFHGPEVIGSPTILPPPPQTVVLEPGDNLFKPAYAQFTNFQPYGFPLTLIIEPVEGTPNDPALKLWAFVSVTNNETQTITTITPQR